MIFSFIGKSIGTVFDLFIVICLAGGVAYFIIKFLFL